MDNNELNKIRALHKTSYKGLFEILKSRKLHTKWPFKIAISVTLFFVILYVINPNKSYNAIKELAELITVIFPCLLGFTLAGYAIVVGFPNIELLEQQSKKDKYSLYQILSYFFATSIILQVSTTAFGFFITWCIKIDITSLMPFYCEPLMNATNIVCLLLVLFIALYSILLTPYIAINLFNLSQTNSMFLTLAKFTKIQEEPIEAKKEGNDDHKSIAQ